MANTNMAENEQNTDAQEQLDSLNGTQKCAILMLLIGEEEASSSPINSIKIAHFCVPLRESSCS